MELIYWINHFHNYGKPKRQKTKEEIKKEKIYRLVCDFLLKQNNQAGASMQGDHKQVVKEQVHHDQVNQEHGNKFASIHK